MTTRQATRLLIQACAFRGVKLDISNAAMNTDSIYLKFEDEKMRSVTVRTHPAKKKHLHKWNLYKGWDGKHEFYDRGMQRYFFPFTRINEMADAIKEYQDVMKKCGGKNSLPPASGGASCERWKTKKTTSLWCAGNVRKKQH